eukprot:30962-Pelagococcus_subviridis.AAC.5
MEPREDVHREIVGRIQANRFFAALLDRPREVNLLAVIAPHRQPPERGAEADVRFRVVRPDRNRALGDVRGLVRDRPRERRVVEHGLFEHAIAEALGERHEELVIVRSNRDGGAKRLRRALAVAHGVAALALLHEEVDPPVITLAVLPQPDDPLLRSLEVDLRHRALPRLSALAPPLLLRALHLRGEPREKRRPQKLPDDVHVARNRERLRRDAPRHVQEEHGDDLQHLQRRDDVPNPVPRSLRRVPSRASDAAGAAADAADERRARAREF